MNSTKSIDSAMDDEQLRTDTEPPLDGTDEDEPAIEIVHAPPRLSQIVGCVGALFGALLASPFVPLAIPFGFAGIVIVAGSLLSLYSIGWLTVGTGMLLIAALISGAYGALSPELMLLAVGSTLVAWDTGQFGIVLGDQLGRQTDSQRNQIVHISATVLVITAISSITYFAFLAGSGSRPGPAVVVIVVGVLVMAWVYRH